MTTASPARIMEVGMAFWPAKVLLAIELMGLVLHDWNLEKKRYLVRPAYEALPPGGAFVVVEHLIDDARRENAFGLMMSLNMLIGFGDAFDFTVSDLFGWCREAGFRRTEVVPLAGPARAGVATSNRFACLGRRDHEHGAGARATSHHARRVDTADRSGLLAGRARHAVHLRATEPRQTG